MPLETPLSPFDRTRRVSCLGIDTFVAEAGQGRPILFLHGNPDTHDAWSGVVALLKQEFACFAPDLPGYGASEPQGDLRLEKQGEWVRELIAALGLQRPHLVVHDVGGTYGLAFTAMYPGLISKLTILNTNFFPDYRWHFWGRVWRTPVLGDLAMLIAFRALFVNEMTKASPRPRQTASAARSITLPSWATGPCSKSPSRSRLSWPHSPDVEPPAIAGPGESPPRAIRLGSQRMRVRFPPPPSREAQQSEAGGLRPCALLPARSRRVHGAVPPGRALPPLPCGDAPFGD
jgi:pimeloyl-ACP methyl ester carboxylesterase